MEQVSYYTSAGAFSVVIICWFAFLLTFLFRKKPEKAKDAVKLPKSWLGIALQGLAYAPVWIVHRTIAFSPFVPSYSVNIALQIAAVGLAIGAVFLTRSAIDELGKQWSLQARLVEDHQLVKTGPYNVVRHPIYSANACLSARHGDRHKPLGGSRPGDRYISYRDVHQNKI